MGLLDDAIREHLELKRRHGADPAELDQQARDALGPSRRDAVEAPAARRGPSDDEAPSDAFELDHEHAARARRASEDDDVPARPARPATPPPAPARDLDPSWDDEDDHDLTPRHQGSVRADRPASDAPLADPERTRAFSVEEERDALGPVPDEPRRERRRAEPVDDADELEQTPEFLEDTPEHDRLWFEQRPPKDFDF